MTLKASSNKFCLQPLYNDPQALGGNEARQTAALGNANLMYCVVDAWERAFSRDKCKLAWVVTSLYQFHQHKYWELLADDQHKTAVLDWHVKGVTGID